MQSSLIQKEIDTPHSPLIYAMWLSSFLNMFAFFFVPSMFGFYILDYFGYGSLELGLLDGCRPRHDHQNFDNKMRLKIGKHGTLIVGCLSVAVGLFGIPLIKFGFVIVAVAFLAIGYGLASPSVVAILSIRSATNQGSVLGIGTA